MENLSVVEYEKAVLGYLILNGNSFDTVAEYLNKDDFFDEANQLIFGSMESLRVQDIEIELVSIIGELNKNKQLNLAGGQAYLKSLLSDPCLKSNITKFSFEISMKSQLRKIKANLAKMSTEILQTKKTPEDILEQIEQQIVSLSNPGSKKYFESAQKIMDRAIKIMEKKATGSFVTGIKSRFLPLDNLTNGFQNSDLIILASRPSMGKTGFALNLAANISRSTNVAFFSLEMPSEQLMNRILAMRTGINSTKLRRPSELTAQEWDQIYHYSTEISKYKLFIDDSPGLKLRELIWKIRKLSKSKNRPEIIIIDYMQLIQYSHKSVESRQIEVTAISRALKQLARELEVPIIALAQLSRRVELREIKIPIMSDLRESGAIEQDADLIMFLYREAYYQTSKNAPKKNVEEVDVIISKHRNGPTGKLQLLFQPSLGRFDLIPKSTIGGK